MTSCSLPIPERNFKNKWKHGMLVSATSASITMCRGHSMLMSPGTVKVGIEQLVKSQTFHYLQCDGSLDDKSEGSSKCSLDKMTRWHRNSLQQMDAHLPQVQNLSDNGITCCTVWCWMLAPYQRVWKAACSGGQLASPIWNTSQMRKCKDAWGWTHRQETVGVVSTVVQPHGVCWPRYCCKCCIYITSSWEAPTWLTKTKVNTLPEGWSGVPQSKVSRCMGPSEMEKTDSRFRGRLCNRKMQRKRRKTLVGVSRPSLQWLH